MKNKEKYLLTIFLIFQLIFSGSAQTADDIRLKYHNPTLIVDLGTGLWGTPIPVDYDEDGLIDIINSCPDTPYRGLYLYRNIGTLSNPLFDVSKKISEVAYKNMKASYPDGELRVIKEGIEFVDFKNSVYSKPDTIQVNLLPRSDFKKVRSNMWSYVDFDNDNDQDILVGIDDWADYGWDNAYNKTGEWMNGPLRGFVYLLENIDGKYMNKGKILAGGQPLETYGAPGVNMADFDNDGRKDLICGEFIDKLTWYRNIGTSSKPKFEKGQFLKDKSGNMIRLYVEMITPVAIDFDKDNYIDLLVGDEDGRVAFIRNAGQVENSMPVFESPVYLRQKANNVKFGALTTPFSVDWDGDGDEDIISGNSAGNIGFIENLDGGVCPRWNAPVLLKTNGDDIHIMAGVNGSIQGPAEEKWGYTTLSVADWDLDGKMDIIVNSIFGKIIWYKNTGDLINLEGSYNVKVDWGDREAPKPEWNWWNPGKTDLVTQWRTTPIATDWNDDGLTDLIVIDQEGFLCFYERFKKNDELRLKPGKRIFYQVDNSSKDENMKPSFSHAIPLQLTSGVAGRSGRKKLCLVDWNKDGRMDLMINTNKGNAGYFENVTQKKDSVLFEFKGNISEIILSGHTTSPTPVDWDKDGVYDILLGAEDGHFYLLKNNIK